MMPHKSVPSMLSLLLAVAAVALMGMGPARQAWLINAWSLQYARQALDPLAAHAVETCQRAGRTKKTTGRLPPGESKPVRCGHNKFSLLTRFAMRNVERAEAGWMSSLFAVLAMDWRRNSGEDEQEDKKDVRRMQEG